MIREVKIENFKCFRQLHLPDLGMVNLVGGANNVGKTALLEALHIFCDRLNQNLFPNHLAWRGLPVIALRPEYLWAPYFYGLDLDRKIRIDVALATGGREWAEYRYDAKYIRSRKESTPRAGKAPVLSTEQTAPIAGCLEITYGWPDGKTGVIRNVIDGARPAFEGEWLPASRRAAIVPARNRIGPEEETARLSAIKEAKQGELVEDFLRIMGDVNDLQVSNAMGRPAIYCDIGLPRLVPLALAGDGMGRLLSIILSAAACQGGLVLVDEVENGIHHSVQEKVWKAIAEAARQLSCQIIATTHSHECLQAAHAAFAGLFEPDFRFIRLERVKEDIVAKTFTHEMLGVALAANLEVR